MERTKRKVGVMDEGREGREGRVVSNKREVWMDGGKGREGGRAGGKGDVGGYKSMLTAHRLANMALFQLLLTSLVPSFPSLIASFPSSFYFFSSRVASFPCTFLRYP